MSRWTSERIAPLSNDQVETLRSNALRREDTTTAALCDEELSKRKTLSKPAKKIATGPRQGAVVGGFHFVCPKQAGVTRNSDGTVWTGTWVVDEKHVVRGERIGAYVALHERKSEPSYLQGTIQSWRITKRDREYAEGRQVQIENGVDFPIKLTEQSYEWRGSGAGEKGYFWVAGE